MSPPDPFAALAPGRGEESDDDDDDQPLLSSTPSLAEPDEESDDDDQPLFSRSKPSPAEPDEESDGSSDDDDDPLFSKSRAPASAPASASASKRRTLSHEETFTMTTSSVNGKPVKCSDCKEPLQEGELRLNRFNGSPYRYQFHMPCMRKAACARIVGEDWGCCDCGSLDEEERAAARAAVEAGSSKGGKPRVWAPRASTKEEGAPKKRGQPQPAPVPGAEFGCTRCRQSALGCSQCSVAKALEAKRIGKWYRKSLLTEGPRPRPPPAAPVPPSPPSRLGSILSACYEASPAGSSCDHCSSLCTDLAVETTEESAAKVLSYARYHVGCVPVAVARKLYSGDTTSRGGSKYERLSRENQGRVIRAIREVVAGRGRQALDAAGAKGGGGGGGCR
jgi:hypothetical protein